MMRQLDDYFHSMETLKGHLLSLTLPITLQQPLWGEELWQGEEQKQQVGEVREQQVGEVMELGEQGVMDVLMGYNLSLVQREERK